MPEDLTGREYAEAVLLLSNSDFDLRLAAKSIYRNKNNRQFVLDLLGESIWHACSEKPSMTPDALSWMAKALGKSRRGRYAEILEYCLTRVDDHKSRSYLDAALGKLEGGGVISLKGGKTDLVMLRKKLLARNTLNRVSLANKQFDVVRPNTSIEAIVDQFGFPDSVTGVNDKRVGELVRRTYAVVQLSDDLIVLGYNGLGTIRFIYDTTRDNWLVKDAESNNNLVWDKRDGKFKSQANKLMVVTGAKLTEYAQELLHREHLDPITLNEIADRIYKSRYENDNQTADGLGWLCKVLLKSGDGKYKKFLLDISENAANRRLRKHARASANDLPDTTSEAYDPSRPVNKMGQI